MLHRIVDRSGFASVLLVLRARRVSAKSFALSILILSLASCTPEPTLEQQIIHVIREMEAHVEAGERRPFMTYVHESFQGQDGAMAYDDFRGFFVLQLNKYNRLQAILMPINVQDLGNGMAGARFQALVTGGNRGLLPEAGQLYQFNTTWLREDGSWLLVTADWEAVVP